MRNPRGFSFGGSCPVRGYHDGVSSEPEFECDVAFVPKCVRCGRVRPMPDPGTATLTVFEGDIYHLETGKECDWNCTETRVRVRVSFGF